MNLQEALANKEEITYLKLSNQNLTEIPNEIFELKKLSVLDLSDNKLEVLPNIWDQLPCLSELILRGNQLTSLPSSLFEFPILSRLDIRRNNFINLSPRVLFIPKLSWLDMDKGIFPQEIRKAKKSFANVLRKKEVSSELQEIFGNMVLERESSLNYPIEYFFKALSISFAPLQLVALDVIRKNWEEKLALQPLQKGCFIAVLGKTSFNKKELKERLKNLGIVLESKITAKTTHVVLEKGIKNHDRFEKENLLFIPETGLQTFLDQTDSLYLTQENSSNDIENIQALLLSLDEDSIAIGLEMINSLGSGEKLITELFLVFKDTNLSTKVRNKAKKQLLLHASPTLKVLLEKHKRVIIIPTPAKKYQVYEHIIAKHLSYFLEGTELDALKAFSFLCQHEKVQSLLSCLKYLSEKEALLFLQQFLPLKKYPAYLLKEYYDLSDFPNSIKKLKNF